MHEIASQHIHLNQFLTGVGGRAQALGPPRESMSELLHSELLLQTKILHKRLIDFRDTCEFLQFWMHLVNCKST